MSWMQTMTPGTPLVMGGLACLALGLFDGCGALRDASGPLKVELEDIRSYSMPSADYVALPEVQLVPGMALVVETRASNNGAVLGLIDIFRGRPVERTYFTPVVAAERDVVGAFARQPADAPVLGDVHLFVRSATPPDPAAVVQLSADLVGHLEVGMPVQGGQLPEFDYTNLRKVAVLTPGEPQSGWPALGLLGAGVLLMGIGGRIVRNSDESLV